MTSAVKKRRAIMALIGAAVLGPLACGDPCPLDNSRECEATSSEKREAQALSVIICIADSDACVTQANAVVDTSQRNLALESCRRKLENCVYFWAGVR